MEDLKKIYEEGVQLYEQKEYTAAVEKFLIAAELGYVEAQFKMSCCYHWGRGVKKDKKQADAWLKKGVLVLLSKSEILSADDDIAAIEGGAYELMCEVAGKVDYWNNRLGKKVSKWLITYSDAYWTSEAKR